MRRIRNRPVAHTRPRRRRFLATGQGSVFVAAVFVVLIVLAAWLDPDRISATYSGSVRVHDGDTLTVDGTRVRLVGIDAPEMQQMCRRADEVWACGGVARDQLRKLTAGRLVTCEGWRIDRYRRPLVTCRADGDEINSRMVREGFAVAYGDYGDEEQVARARRLGLWSGSFEKPAQWRADHKREEGPQSDLIGILVEIVRRFFRLS